MTYPAHTIHFEFQEELVERPMYPSIGWHSDLQGARDSTAAYLRVARRAGASVSTTSLPGRKWDGDPRHYMVRQGRHTVCVVCDAHEDDVEYHEKRQREIAKDMRARGEME